MHPDCGCCLAYSKIDAIVDNLQKNLTISQLQEFRKTIGEPFRENLLTWLKAFEDPQEAVKREISALRALPFMPQQAIIHGLVYELASGKIKVILNGYES